MAAVIRCQRRNGTNARQKARIAQARHTSWGCGNRFARRDIHAIARSFVPLRVASAGRKEPRIDSHGTRFVVDSSPLAGSSTTSAAYELHERSTQCCVNEQTGTHQHFSLELKDRPSILTGDTALIFQRNFNIGKTNENFSSQGSADQFRRARRFEFASE
jgi:hypothetical protein